MRGDGMTRGEAINNLKRVGECLDMTYANEQEKEELEAINMAIEALEQEPILDKIRAEIEELKPHSHYTQEMKNKVLEIIDKHRGES